MTTSNLFTRSYERFLSSENKKSLIEPEEICSNFVLQPEEIEVFLKLGTSDINKSKKTNDEIEHDKDVVVGTHITDTDPRRLLLSKKSVNKE